MTHSIHPSAIIEEGAIIGQNVRIGPFCVVGKDVALGDDVILESHVVLAGRTDIGPGTHIFPFASIGHAPQDLKYQGEPSIVTIGSDNVIREYVTIQPGTKGGGMETTLGNHCLLMVGAHMAHDCHVGNHVILANNVTLAGHVTIEDYVILGGLSAVHQFVRVGKHAIIGGMAGVAQDVIPYASITRDTGWLGGVNLVGLKRRGFSRDAIHRIRDSYKTLFDSNAGSTFSERVNALAMQADDDPEVMEIVQFLKAESDRSYCQPRETGAPSLQPV